MGSSQAWLVEDLAAATTDGENGFLDGRDLYLEKKAQRYGQACAGISISIGIAH